MSTSLSMPLQKATYTLAIQPWQGQFGLALILLSLLFWLFIVMPKSAQLTSLNADIQQQKKLQFTKPNQVNMPSKPSETERLIAMLPDQYQANTITAQVLQTAIQQGLPIDKVEYSLQGASKTKLQTLQIKLPTKGSYVQIRQFINLALNAQPSLALSDVSFNRDDLSVEQVEANMVFTLYLQQK
ncbi:MAG TPA: type 4a pilus biogenesis protein PilO [Methylotenera sp.]|nr:type 4a pilus biogenesis protein PilO [Methylotenera sp.]HPH08555.1 type 4a pilus biogenesis protein PilO [Methylotenera sp.]HPM48689.1 type 4a pilus biogenesis protein PilO [Methylotenera sp.]